jgi:8-oxo-dGTP pyrophosphatase MutT (NUDIX family)
MVRRHQASKFAADVFVFPGGTVRQDDHLSAAEARALGLDPPRLEATLRERDDPFARREDGGLALWVAALRELFEEAGVLLAEDASGELLDLSEPGRADRFEALRGAVQRGDLSLAALARQEGLRLAADRLLYFSRWITPAASPRRYDTRFLLAELPSGQTAGHCQIETTDGLWIAPREALARHARGEHPMVFVTTEHVKRLAEFADAPSLLAFARTKGLKVVRPVIDGRNEVQIPPEQRRSW